MIEKIRYSEIFYSDRAKVDSLVFPACSSEHLVATSTVMDLDKSGTDQNGSSQRTCHTTHRTSQN